MIVFAVGIVVHDYVRDRGGATERVLETVRGIRFTLDAEIRRMTGGLQVLALTDANVKIRLHRAHEMLRSELMMRAGASSTQAFLFPATRCDRVVHGVFERLKVRESV